MQGIRSEGQLLKLANPFQGMAEILFSKEKLSGMARAQKPGATAWTRMPYLCPLQSENLCVSWMSPPLLAE